MGARRGTPIERFWRHVDTTSGFAGCWIWTGVRNSHGYGQLGIGGRMVYAHRLSHELHTGPIPDGLHVLHSCDNPPCVNPGHLRVGTRSENLSESVARGRAGVWTHPERIARGETSGQAILTSDRVMELRRAFAAGAGPKAIAAHFGLARSTVEKVVYGDTWRHLPILTRPSLRPRRAA